MKKSLALVTNFYYPAKGREHYREDILLSKLLRDNFRLALVHLEDLECVASYVDAILIRNTGPKSEHKILLNRLKINNKWSLFNDLSGKVDIQGKQHLLTLFAQGYPVIPTVDSISDIDALGEHVHYLIKPIDGCDSHGLQIVTKEEIEQLSPKGFVIQAKINFAKMGLWFKFQILT